MLPSDPTTVLLRLAPHAVVLRRDVGELQVGVQPAVVVPVGYAPVLTRLTGTVSAAAVLEAAVAAGLPGPGAQALLRSLSEAGLLVTEVGSPPQTGSVLRLIGSGRLGRRTASVLAASGVAALYLGDAPPDAPPTSGPAPADRAAGLAASLAARHPAVTVRPVRHWAKPDGVAVDLTIVAADGPEVDRLLTDTFLAADQPHLLLRSSGAEVSVGPLVVPGQTSCVRCADLARRDADPQWPWVLAQLTRVRLDPAPSLLAWASACAATQALAFVAGRMPESAGHTLELTTRDHLPRLRPWPIHAACGCRWADGTE